MEQRVPPLRSPGRGRKPPSIVAILFILLFFLGISMVLFLKSPLSEIREIRIEGNRWLSDREVMETARLMKEASWFHWDAKRAEDRLRDLPEVKEASVIKSFPGMVRIQLREVNRVGYLSERGHIYPLLSDGSVLKKRPWKGKVDRPLVKGLNQSPERKMIAAGLAQLPLQVSAEISEIRPGGNDTYPDLVKVYTLRDHLIRVRARDFGEKMKYYPHFMDRPPGTIHLLESTWYVPGNQLSGAEE
ncbi:hypothetical protein GCM10007416_01550 [Kroppenstedtia guangzhouensis]|jgi:cell division protein FtsQ|uniref:POTRA domain-containing protein n=1 Tax=Kroppenstedtia guangzhouensis TaxID=1274356 RepID=A0ABQ1FXY7_9BACL|nr:FtsQ-type POTRA domain-containing protein [Kroppenstedtia guangzhouensis]GGA32643.1 hypothetical protein GCM10007416_01550 [Kroppenstedtia guangzhouensis]